MKQAVVQSHLLSTHFRSNILKVNLTFTVRFCVQEGLRGGHQGDPAEDGRKVSAVSAGELAGLHQAGLEHVPTFLQKTQNCRRVALQ